MANQLTTLSELKTAVNIEYEKCIMSPGYRNDPREAEILTAFKNVCGYDYELDEKLNNYCNDIPQDEKWGYWSAVIIPGLEKSATTELNEQIDSIYIKSAEVQAKELFDHHIALSQKSQLATRWQREEWSREASLFVKQTERDMLISLTKEITDKPSKFIITGKLVIVEQVIDAIKAL